MALEMIKRSHEEGNSFDLIFLDWEMPVLNGIDLLLELKTNPKLGKIPVLIATARSDIKDVVRAISAGASDYIVKPLDHEMIFDKLKSIWARFRGTT